MATTAIERYALAALKVGCPRDQWENFARAGICLQPRQLLASAAARACDEEGGPVELGYGGARAGGKSFWLLAQIGADDCQRQAGLKCLILRKVLKAARESFEDLRQQVLSGLRHEYRRQEGVLTFPNCSRIILGHYRDEREIEAYLGLEYDVIGVEEATTLTSQKYQGIGTCARTSKAGWRPRLYDTTNPGGVGHAWFKQRFIDPYRRERETETRFIPATVDDNRFVNPEYKLKLDGLTGWQKEAWRHGNWDIAAGQFFTTWRHDLHVIPSRIPPKHWRFWCAMDYGFTHYTVVYLMAQDGDGNLYVVDEHAERRWLPQRHAEAIRGMLARNGLQLFNLSGFVAGADVFAARGEKDGQAYTIAAAYKQEGIELTPANQDRISGASEVLKRLGDSEASPAIPARLFVMDRCARLIECLPALQHDPHRPEDVLKWDTDDDGIGGDDPYDGMRYGVMAAWGTAMRTAGSEAPSVVQQYGQVVGPYLGGGR